MVKVKIICVGNLKEKYWRDAVSEYQKRLGAFCTFEIVELQEERLPDSPSQSQIDKALEKEAERILNKVGRMASVYAMCIEGKCISSEKLAEKMTADMQTASEIDFIIGSSFGLSDTVKSKANMKLSMSPMTFPHQLARVMLCEQIYRAFQISRGGKYHK